MNDQMRHEAWLFGVEPTNPKPEDPYESEEYQKFVESMVPLCHCAARFCPCDGVLAGGLCDGMDSMENDRDSGFDDEDEQ